LESLQRKTTFIELGEKVKVGRRKAEGKREWFYNWVYNRKLEIKN
jgi:hypothetical protein